MADQAEDLQREIFGGSDDEDLSSDDDFQSRRRPQAEAAGAASGSEVEEDGDYKDDDGNRPLPAFQKNKSASGGDKQSRPRQKRRSRQKEARVEEEDLPADEPPMTEEERAKAELRRKIELAARAGRSNRPKKRKKGDEDELDAAADAEVNKIKIAMEVAALEDQEANKNGKPALAKLRMLPDVMDVLQKQSLIQSIIDANLLDTVRLWLEPLTDKSLPSLTIQRQIFEVLGKMFIDTNALKESGLGKIVLFYTKKNKRVAPTIKNQADNLIAAWSRPILKRSASYRDRTLVMASSSQSSSQAAQKKKKGPKLAEILAQNRLEEAGRLRRNAVRIPERPMAAFDIVPRSNVGGASQASGTGAGNAQQAALEIEKRRAAEARLRRVQRKVDLNKQRVSRM